jgi:hypothetical protein
VKRRIATGLPLPNPPQGGRDRKIQDEAGALFNPVRLPILGEEGTGRSESRPAPYSPLSDSLPLGGEGWGGGMRRSGDGHFKRLANRLDHEPHIVVDFVIAEANDAVGPCRVRGVRRAICETRRDSASAGRRLMGGGSLGRLGMAG